MRTFYAQLLPFTFIFRYRPYHKATMTAVDQIGALRRQLEIDASEDSQAVADALNKMRAGFGIEDASAPPIVS